MREAHIMIMILLSAPTLQVPLPPPSPVECQVGVLWCSGVVSGEKLPYTLDFVLAEQKSLRFSSRQQDGRHQEYQDYGSRTHLATETET
ncbi:hypothetical protein BaRGS_00035212 [Batillaria attramentaria]|uniref:Uncharacterized protein n=1 Tax=Batillaria attramentaria TaxID=370345 RepID=A0ABD0JG25_9CAEN